MTNTCTELIKSGPNKGLICKDAVKRCRHCNIVCKQCGSEYTRHNSYYNHVTKCNAGNSGIGNSGIGNSDTNLVSNSNSNSNSINANRDANTNTNTNNTARTISDHDILMSHRTLMETLKQMQESIEYLKNRTPIDIGGISFNIDLTNYCSMGEDIYDGLVAKLGKPEALSFISNSVKTNKPMEMFRKLYLEGNDPRQYPVAAHQRDMRYVDCTRELVSDVDGKMLAFLIQNSIQNALLKAANDIIDQKLQYDTDCQDNTICCQNFFGIQTYALAFKTHITRSCVIETLIDWVSVEDHPFFSTVLCIKATHRNYLPDRKNVTL